MENIALKKIGLMILVLLLGLFILFALLDFVGIIVDNPIIPGK